MDNRKAVLISAVCFGISLLLVSAYVSVKESELTRDFGEKVKVVAAKQFIPEYGIIRPEMLKVVEVFKKFKQPQTVEDINDIVGKAAYVPIYEDEQVALTKLIHQDGKPVLDRELEKTYRAITLQIAPHTGVGRLIRPGNRVDLLATVNYEMNNSNIFETKTMVQNVLVLATGKQLFNAVPSRVNREILTVLESEMESRRRKDIYGTSTESLNTGRPDDNYSTITLQLTPADAEKVLYIAQRFGESRIYYALRNNSDGGTERLETTLLDNILGPNSNFGRSKIKIPSSPPTKPRFFDIKGGQPEGVY